MYLKQIPYLDIDVPKLEHSKMKYEGNRVV